MAGNDFLRVALAVAAKDLRIELRTKTALVGSLVFAILVLAVLYFARDRTVVSELDMAPGVLWVTFTFAGMVGLNRAFLLEKEHRALDGLLLTSASPTAIFVGKALANLVFVGTVELIAIPIFIVFYNLPIWHEIPMLLLVTATATLAFVAIGSLLSAMAVHTRLPEVMLSILLLPFLVTPIVGAVTLTGRILADRPLSELSGWLSLLALFDVVFVTLSILLFEATLEE